MIGFLEGLMVTLKTAGRKPVTAQYPQPDKRQAVQDRFMGFPALTWDEQVSEPYCTGCMVCIRNCPTQCMSAEMKDNPLAAEGKSGRRKIIDTFEINLGRCILCAICVDVCNFDAIEMSHEHELSKYQRNGNRVDLPELLEMGKEFQAKVHWTPSQPEKNSGIPKARPSKAEAAAASDAPAKSDMSKEERLAATRARVAAKKAESSAEAPLAEAAPPVVPKTDMTKEERLAASRARSAAKKSGTPQAEQPVAEIQTTPSEGDAPANAKSEMSSEERVAAARARSRAKREAAEPEEESTEPTEPVEEPSDE